MLGKVISVQALSEMLKVNQTIAILDLQANLVGSKGAEVRHGDDDATLGWRLVPCSWEAIAEALKRNHSIKELYLNGNEIGDSAMKASH